MARYSNEIGLLNAYLTKKITLKSYCTYNKSSKEIWHKAVEQWQLQEWLWFSLGSLSFLKCWNIAIMHSLNKYVLLVKANKTTAANIWVFTTYKGIDPHNNFLNLVWLLLMRKLRHTEVIYLYMYSNWQSWDLNLGNLAPDSTFLTTVLCIWNLPMSVPGTL